MARYVFVLVRGHRWRVAVAATSALLVWMLGE
jgi:hypothetical protein